MAHEENYSENSNSIDSFCLREHLENISTIQKIIVDNIIGNCKKFKTRELRFNVSMPKSFFPIVSMFFCVFGLVAASATEIQWEITNRFAPFVTQADSEEGRADLFDLYKLNPGENFESWHRRLAEKGSGIQSPYRDALASGNHSKRMHWDQEKSRHSQEILKFIRNEGDASTTIGIKAWIDKTGMCIWSAGKGDSKPEKCRHGWTTSIPLKGAKVTAVSDGKSFTEHVEPKHIVILAMGDSFASGEGNPDYPGVWKNGVKFRGKDDFIWLTKQKNLVSPREGSRSSKKRRHWVDDSCHRSFFSHQSLLALRIASQNTQSFVSFFHYACTGAEIFDGLLVPQYQAWGSKGKYVPYSQVNFAIRELCKTSVDVHEYSGITTDEQADIEIEKFLRRGGKNNIPDRASLLEPGDNFSKSTKPLRIRQKTPYPDSGFLRCIDDSGSSNIRIPDHVFLTVTGNDFGFADVVSYYLVPSKWQIRLTARKFIYPDVCPTESNRVDRNLFPNLTRHCDNKDYDAGHIVASGKPGGIENRLRLLTNVLRTRLGVNPEIIAMPQYPDQVRAVAFSEQECDPLSMEKYWTKNSEGETVPAPGKIIGDADGVFKATSAWNGVKSGLPRIVINAADFSLTGATRRKLEQMEFNLTVEDATLALREFEVLRPTLARAARGLGINFICATRDVFMGYGWNKGSRLNLPNSHDTHFETWDLTTWDPYVYEVPTRATRTGNDSALTQPGDKQFTGTAHPNLTGHRLMAERMYKHLFKQGVDNQ